MTRLHVHLSVSDLDQSIGFYSALFGRAPDKRESDYAKWMLENPAANIAISSGGETAGVDHVGLQFDDRGALAAIATRLKDAGHGALPEMNATCCYARSDKHWAMSPDGAAKWELFHTFGDAEIMGSAPAMTADTAAKAESACCV